MGVKAYVKFGGIEAWTFWRDVLRKGLAQSQSSF